MNFCFGRKYNSGKGGIMHNNMVEEGLVRSSEDVILISVLAWCLYYELCKLT